MHTHKLVRIIEGLECYNLSDLISSYDHEKFILLQKLNPNRVKIPANKLQSTQFVARLHLLLVLLIKTPTPNIEETTSSSRCSTVFSVENTKTPISSTRSKTQHLFGRKLLKASAAMIMRSLQVF